MTKEYRNYNEVIIPGLLKVSDDNNREAGVRRKQYARAYAFILAARRYYAGLLPGNLAVETAKLYFRELPKERARSLKSSSADIFRSACPGKILDVLSKMKGIVTIRGNAETGSLTVTIDTYFEKAKATIDRKGRISLRIIL